MFIVMNERFRDDVRRYRLAFTCEDCASWHAEKEACTILYPSAPHRRAHVEQLADGEQVFFCKMFEARCEPDEGPG